MQTSLVEKDMLNKNEEKTKRAKGYELFGLLSAISIALFQVVFVWTRNARKVELNVLTLNVLIAISLMLVIYLTLRVLTNDALFGTLLSGLVFETSYYFLNIYEAVNSWFTISKTALIVILALLAAVLALVLRRPAKRISKKNVKSKLLLLLCVIGWGLILFNVVANFTSVSLSVKRATRESTTPVIGEKGPANDALTDAEKPNIYLIVLDEYARTDMMKQQYGFDNTAFDAYLTGKGFHVSSTSENEIAATDVQSANLLNLDYVFFASNLQLSGLPGENLYNNYADYRTKSYLFDLLRANGYHSIAIDNPGVMYTFGNVNADEVLKMEVSTGVKITFDQNEVDGMTLSCMPWTGFGIRCGDGWIRKTTRPYSIEMLLWCRIALHISRTFSQAMIRLPCCMRTFYARICRLRFIRTAKSRTQALSALAGMRPMHIRIMCSMRLRRLKRESTICWKLILIA